MRERLRQGVERRLHLAADEVGDHRCAAAIRHVDGVDTGGELEQLAREVARRADAERGHADLAGIGPGIGDELADRAHRQRRIHHEHQRELDKARHRHDVAQEVEGQRGIERGVGGVGGSDV
jgi:hypothetical protein